MGVEINTAIRLESGERDEQSTPFVPKSKHLEDATTRLKLSSTRPTASRAAD